ncbi:hypothetical protein ACFE04_007767 [Oxalis oulophora]
MSIINIQILTTLLLIFISSSTIKNAYGQETLAESSLDVDKLDWDSALPRITAEAQKVSSEIGRLKICLAPVLQIGGCFAQIVKAVASEKFGGVASTCCQAIINPLTFDCLTEILTIIHVPVPKMHLRDQLKGLQTFCAAIPSTSRRV